MTTRSSFPGKHLVILGIQVWDAAVANFQVPAGSKPRPCGLCHEATFVQGSALKIIATGQEHTIVCYRCARHLPASLAKDNEVLIAPEAREELERMRRTRRQ